MKKMMLFVTVLAAAVLFSACASVEVVKDNNLSGQKIANSGTTLAHIDVQNYGFYLFSIPLLVGSVDKPGKSVDLLTDNVTVEALLPVLTAESKKLGATKVLNIASQYSETGFIIYTRSLNISGNAVK